MKLEKLTVKELTKLQAEVSEELPKAKERERQETLAKVEALCKKHGYDFKKLMGPNATKRRKRAIKRWKDQKTGVIYMGVGRKPPNFDMSRAVQIGG